MKKILLLATGGTIAMSAGKGASGLDTAYSSSDIAEYIRELSPETDVDHKDILRLDSSNIQPEEWQVVARAVYKNLPSYDGIIITHGTDTMAYTASAVSFMLRNIGKSVVFTGSQLPMDRPLTDAKTNLYTAVSAVLHDFRGVTVAFDRKIINATRAVKVSTMGFNAFESVNAQYMGQIMADGMRVKSSKTAEFDRTRKAELYDSLFTDVFLLKLIPGTKPEFFDYLADAGYKGIVIEAFGSGGMHFLNRNLIDKLNMLAARGVAVVVCSQCLYEKTDLATYSVGRRVLETGVISGMDMTTEAAVTKLMWALGQNLGGGVDDVVRIFNTNIAGEVTLH